MGDRKNTMHNAQVVIRSPRQLKALIDILHTSLTMWLAGWCVGWLFNNRLQQQSETLPNQ